MKAIVVTAVLVLLIGCPGCKDKSSSSQQSGDEYLKMMLVGTWVREWEFGPVVYERVLNLDGTLVSREFRAVEGKAIDRMAPSRLHRFYNVNLPLCQEFTGTWEIKDGQICYQMKMADGPALKLLYKVGRVSATEFVESAAGVDDKTDAVYLRQRKGFVLPSPSSAAASKPGPTSRKS